MDSLLNDFSTQAAGIYEVKLYQGPVSASDMFKLTRESIEESLAEVFQKIRKAALEGNGTVEIECGLDQTQVWYLEKLGYTIENIGNQEWGDLREGEEILNTVWEITWFDQYWNLLGDEEEE
jgi:hypothetical protein